MGRMRGKVGRHVRSPALTHPLPKRDRLAGIVTGARHVNQAELIGLRFVLTPSSRWRPSPPPVLTLNFGAGILVDGEFAGARNVISGSEG